MIMSRDDLKAISSFIHFSGMGVLPSAERATAVLSIVQSADPGHNLRDVTNIAKSVLGGMLPSQSSCSQAYEELSCYAQDQMKVHIEGMNNNG